MPTYEYVCGACGHEFERFQKISDRPIRRCPECGERKAERRISTGGGVVFKGPGFYATDYRKGGPKGSRAEGEGEAKGGAAKEGTKGKDGGSDGSGEEPRAGAGGDGSEASARGGDAP